MMEEKKPLNSGHINETTNNIHNPSIPQDNMFLNIPESMRNRTQWLVWGVLSRDLKPNPVKITYQPNGQIAKINDPSTWITFDKAYNALLSNVNYKGLGYVFTEDDMFVGISIDNCVDDKGNINEDARIIINDMGSYTEYSHSGRGITIIVEANIPDGKFGTRNIEICGSRGYFSMTGNIIEGCTSGIASRQNQINSLYSRLFKNETETSGKDIVNISEPEIIQSSSPTKSTVNSVVSTNSTLFTGMPQPKSGFLYDFMSWASKGTDAPDEFLLISGIMTAAAALTKNGSYWLQFGALPLYPIIWALILAGSSSFRKTTALNYARRPLEVALPDSIFADRVTPESFYQLLEKQPSGLFIVSEFGALLKQFDKSYSTGFKEDLTELFDCPSVFKRQKKGRNDSIKVYCARNPRISIFGASTLDWFTDRITESDATSGFLPRFLFVTANKRTKPVMRIPSAISSSDPVIVNWLQHLGSVTGTVQFDNTSPGYNEYDKFCSKIEKDVFATGLNLSTIEPFSERLKIYVLKLALVCEAVKPNSSSVITTISIDSMTEACSFAWWFWSNIKSLLVEDISFSQFTRKQKKIEDILRQCGGQSSRRDLLRASHYKLKEFNEVAETMIASEIIKEVKNNNNIGYKLANP